MRERDRVSKRLCEGVCMRMDFVREKVHMSVGKHVRG